MRETIGCPERSWSYPRTDSKPSVKETCYARYCIRSIPQWQPQPVYTSLRPVSTGGAMMGRGPAVQLDEQGRKLCPKCQTPKELEAFGKGDGKAFGKHSWCKACINERRRNHYDTDVAYRMHLQFTYGLSIDQYLSMYYDQGGRCASCKDRLELRSRSRIAVDHDHHTGKVRGLLCNACNSALGMLRDDHRRIQGLARYLKRAEKKPASEQVIWTQLSLMEQKFE
jgi:hypothetical protein